MFPGMCQCGGTGPNSFDLLTPLLDWVETSTAPQRVARTSELAAIRARN
jgi:feruloyl esterase